MTTSNGGSNGDTSPKEEAEEAASPSTHLAEEGKGASEEPKVVSIPIEFANGLEDVEEREGIKRKSRFLSSRRDSEDRDGGEFSLADANLEKYRPHNHSLGPRKGSETDDINDIMDYYCNLGSRARALRRLNHYPSFGETNGHHSSNNDSIHNERAASTDPDGYFNGGVRKYSAPSMSSVAPPYHDFDSNNNNNSHNDGFRSLRRPKKINNNASFEDHPLSQPEQPLEGSRGEDEGLDESSRFLIDKARSVRNNPVWSDLPGSKYDWNNDSFLNEPSRAPQEEEERESTLNPKTRDLLNKLRQSTADLEGINSDDARRPSRFSREPDDFYGGPKPRKPSRFLKQPLDDYDDRGSGNWRDGYRGRYDPEPSYEPTDSYYVDEPYYNSRPRDNRMSGRPLHRSQGRESEYREPPRGVGGGARRRREPSTHGMNRYSDYWDEEPPPPRRNNGRLDGGFEQRSSRPTSRYQPQEEDDDIDAMISDLKRKTTGRDMRAVASRIEGRAITPPSNSYYGRYDERDPEDGGRYNSYY